jgi:DNA-directed RNA polymerase specialized sigma subunit
MEPKIDISPTELRAILKEYEYDPDIMCEDDERVIRIKRALQRLQDPDKILWCLYMDLGASRKVGKVLGVSHSTVLKEINRIKLEIRYQMMIDDYDIS